RGAGYLMAFGGGILCFWIVRLFLSGFHHPDHPLVKPIPMEMNDIADQDRWILNYQVFAVPLYEIDSAREYILLILRPKEMATNNNYTVKISRFVISGLADSDISIAIGIEPAAFKDIVYPQLITTLLDFGGSISGKKRARLTDHLVMSSDKY